MTRRSHITSPLLAAALLAAALLVAALPVAPAEARPRQQVVVLVGLPGSGKTTQSRSLARIMRARRHTCGDVVRGWIKARGLPYTPKNDRMASRHFARTPGEIARQLSAKIKRSRVRTHIVDGVRSPADMKVLRQEFDVRVVALKLPQKVRYQRMLDRGRFANEDHDYLKARDRREIGLGLLHVLRKPFLRMDTSGPLSSVAARSQQISRKLKQSWSGK